MIEKVRINLHLSIDKTKLELLNEYKIIFLSQ